MSSTDQTTEQQEPKHYTLEVHDVESTEEVTDPTQEESTDGETD